VSDYAAAKHPRVPEARLMHNTLCTLVAMPAGLLLYGWALQRGAHLALIILAQVCGTLVLGSCACFSRPAVHACLDVQRRARVQTCSGIPGMVGSWVLVVKYCTSIATPNIIAVEHVQLLRRGLLYLPMHVCTSLCTSKTCTIQVVNRVASLLLLLLLLLRTCRC
jgi:hypothetical protein